MIRVLLAEDQTLLREAMTALLNLEPDIEVVASVADGEAAWQALQTQAVDIVLTDIEMPRLSGLALAQRLAENSVAAKVVIITTFARAGFLRRALDAGVQGYLLKDAPMEKLTDALRQVMQGRRAIEPQLALEAWQAPDPLTERERQILRMAGEGLSNKVIARELELSPGTVRNYLSEAISKLGVANRVEAYRIAWQKGWL
ncbi:DNA-binding response regulator [Lysobacteraceae bacterium NML08-0793]|nr:DNA-binding response regulator [Xanthomonadaceae bacterium NML08-0793]